jgi:hypothetical protein
MLMNRGDSGGILVDCLKEVQEKARVKEVIEVAEADCAALLESAHGIVGGILELVSVPMKAREICCRKTPQCPGVEVEIVRSQASSFGLWKN